MAGSDGGASSPCPLQISSPNDSEIVPPRSPKPQLLKPRQTPPQVLVTPRACFSQAAQAARTWRQLWDPWVSLGAPQRFGLSLCLVPSPVPQSGVRSNPMCSENTPIPRAMHAATHPNAARAAGLPGGGWGLQDQSPS